MASTGTVLILEAPCPASQRARLLYYIIYISQSTAVSLSHVPIPEVIGYGHWQLGWSRVEPVHRKKKHCVLLRLKTERRAT